MYYSAIVLIAIGVSIIVNQDILLKSTKSHRRETLYGMYTGDF